jgi:hypothetical protein
MEQSMRDNTTKERKMGEASSPLLMVQCMKGTSRWMKSVDMASINGVMESDTRENGSIIKCMGKAI